MRGIPLPKEIIIGELGGSQCGPKVHRETAFKSMHSQAFRVKAAQRAGRLEFEEREREFDSPPGHFLNTFFIIHITIFFR